MIETPKSVDTPMQLVAVIHIETPRIKDATGDGAAVGEVLAAVKAQGIGPTGPWFAHHLKMEPDAFDLDICVPVSSPVSPVGRVKSWQRPALKVVRTLYYGAYEGLGGAWHEFGKWTEAHGSYECYVVGPEATSDSVTGVPNSAGQ